MQSCIPSAHLASMGMEWENITTDNNAESKLITWISVPSLFFFFLLCIIGRYKTNWICKEEDSFVDCGMNFTYEDQKLRVPVCGVYEIYSQVFFQSNAPNTAAVVLHTVEINRNCNPSIDNTAEFKSYAGLVPVSVSRATTTNLATVKMCTGGNVSVVIPQESACCAHGGKSTYFSVRLISKVDCNSIQLTP